MATFAPKAESPVGRFSWSRPEHLHGILSVNTSYATARWRFYRHLLDDPPSESSQGTIFSACVCARARVLIFSCAASSPHSPGLPIESITRQRLLLMLLMHWPHALEQTSAVRQRGCMHVARTCRQPATLQGPMSC